MSSTERSTLSVAVISGKGGVGKTNITLNTGLALHKAGSRILLMDCDLGLANLDVLLGIAPKKNIQDFLTPGTTPDEVIAKIKDEGFDLLPAASGVFEMVEMDDDLQSYLLEKLNDILPQYDYFFLDLGAGISKTVLTLAAAAQERMIIITPEPTSLTDGYAMIKVMNNDYGISNFRIVVNQARDEDEGMKSFERLQAACRRFLEIDIDYMGYVRYDAAVSQAVMDQTPLIEYDPQSTASQDISALAEQLSQTRDTVLSSFPDKPVLTLPTLK